MPSQAAACDKHKERRMCYFRYTGKRDLSRAKNFLKTISCRMFSLIVIVPVIV